MKLSVINTKADSQQRKLRVCAYVRVSSEKDTQMESLENQEAYFVVRQIKRCSIQQIKNDCS